MVAITHRVGLGRNLTAAEVDANFDNLNTAVSGGGISADADNALALGTDSKPFLDEDRARSYVQSSPIAITAATDSASSFAHGLGVVPRRCGMMTVCQVANNGYSVGDVIFNHGYRAATTLITVSADATNVTASWDSNVSGTLLLAPKAGGTAVGPGTAGDWAIVLWAEV